MDPGFVERHWAELPNLDALRHRGGFRRLATTMPPQSPVAWTSFLTCLEPARHGVFDFVERDPKTMELYSSLGGVEPPRFHLPLGAFDLPLSAPRFLVHRHGNPFWSGFESRGIRTSIFRLPANFPPFAEGEELSGMGTPDLAGTLGVFTLFTDDPDETPRDVPGGRIRMARNVGGRVEMPIEGPPNTLRKDRRTAIVTAIADVDPSRDLVRIAAGDDRAILKPGEWSGWMPLDFPLIPGLASARGMVRFHALAMHPYLRLYVSPVNIDPASPALPISYPARFSRDLAARIGRFDTLGIPEDTAAPRDGVFTLDDFLAQSRLVLSTEMCLFHEALRRFHGGFLFFYFSSVDQNSHMLWGRHEPELLAVYRAVDAAVGEAMRGAPPATLMVMSDHGFAPFDRAVHLNRWLAERGYLAVDAAGHIAWRRTRAYAIGLNGLYLNLAGREAHGIVAPGAEARALRVRIRAELLGWRDAENQRPVITAVEARDAAPDLIVGYASGYRASWQTALGEAPPSLIDDNDDAWIADHCIDPSAVPGVLFSSSPLTAGNPRIENLGVVISRLLEARAPAQRAPPAAK